MRIGRNIRDLDIPFKDEVEFSINNNFDIIQLWYSKGVLDLVYVDDQIEEIKNSNIQTIIHGSFDINDFDKYSDDYIKLLLDLNHKETIIHPVIKSEKINKKTNNILVSNVLKLVNRLKSLARCYNQIS